MDEWEGREGAALCLCIPDERNCSSPLGAGPQSCNAKLSGRPAGRSQCARAAPAGTANAKRRLASMGARGLRAFNKLSRGTVPSPERLDVVSTPCAVSGTTGNRREPHRLRRSFLPGLWMRTAGILLSCILLQIESTTRTDPSQATCMMRARSVVVVVGAQT